MKMKGSWLMIGGLKASGYQGVGMRNASGYAGGLRKASGYLGSATPKVFGYLCVVMLTAVPLGAQTTGAGAQPVRQAQAAGNPSGHWEGTIQAPGAQIGVEIDLAKNSQGQLAGTIAIPTQNLRGLNLSNVVLAGTSVSFQVKGSAPGDRVFEGAVSADSTSISGDFTQMGFTMPFALTRTGEARIEAPPTSAPIGKELEGTWNGTLDVNGMSMRLVLTLSNHANGTSSGAIANVDQGLELPIATITHKTSNVTLDLKVVSGTYSGVLNATGTELVGTFTLGPNALPLTFRRAATEGKK